MAVQQPGVVQPQVDLQQPPPIVPEPFIEESVVGVQDVEDVSVSLSMNMVPSLTETVDLVMGDRVDMVLEQTSKSIGTSAPIGLDETDPVIIALDAALETGSSPKILDKGKGVIEERVKDTVDDMLTQKEYYKLVRKDMLNKIFKSDREKLDLFRAKLNNVSSDTAAVVRFSQPARTSIRIKVIGGSSSSIQTSNSLPVMIATIPVESTCVASSIAELPQVSSSHIPSTPRFSSLRTSTSSSNMFVVLESSSLPLLPPLPSDLFSRSPIIQRPSGPRMILPTSTTGGTSSSGGCPRIAFFSTSHFSSETTRKDAATTAKHETLVKAIDQIHQIITDLVELLAAQGENSALQGESGSGAKTGQDKCPSADDFGSLSDPGDHDFSTDVILGEGDVLVDIVEELRTFDEIPDKYDYVETCKGKNIEYESVGVNMNDLRSYVLEICKHQRGIHVLDKKLGFQRTI
ncbi:hypothetical protein Hanom_Chr13g01220761 [Helianthus anomalus]